MMWGSISSWLLRVMRLHRPDSVRILSMMISLARMSSGGREEQKMRCLPCSECVAPQ